MTTFREARLKRLNLTAVGAVLWHMIPALVVAGLFVYAYLTGASWRGVFNPNTNQVTLRLLAIAAVLWLAQRHLRGLPWARTALDGLLPVWVAAFALSTLTNTDMLTRSLIGLWFAGLYVAEWYVLQDLLNSCALRLETLADCLILASIAPLVVAVQQAGRIPRIVGSMQHPNTLGTMLELVIPLACARLLSTRGWRRAPYAVYVPVALAALILTVSRGAWLAMLMAGLCAGMLAWWRRRWFRLILPVLIAAAVPGVALLNSLRDDGFRIEMWRAASDIFRYHPLFGRGLTTYKFWEPYVRGLGIQTQAHNMPLQIAAELGSLGLLAVGLTGLVMAWTAWNGLRATRGSERLIRAGACAALVGFLAHHLTDFTVINPAIALTLVLVLCIAAAPVGNAPLAPRWRGVTVIGLVVAILVAGYVSVLLHPYTVMYAIGLGQP